MKNATGKDSPETSRDALCRNAADLLREAGVAVRDGVKGRDQSPPPCSR